jgi:DHA1 family bicyclomycin/chloramphenicol resistance-like MFS transporter
MTGLPDASVPARPQSLSGAMLFLLAGLAALGSLATNIILPAFPHIGADLGVNERDLALTLSSFFIAFAVGQLFVGPLSDRFGRKGLVLGGIVLFGLGSALCAFAPNLDVMILGRIIQALGACAASVLSRAIARDLFDGDALARALALVMVAMAASPGFSPLIGTALDSLLSWQLIFAGVAAFGAVIAWVYLATIGETLPPSRRIHHSPAAIAGSYLSLARDTRFMLPALAVSFIIGGLYTFFAAAPAILINVLGLTGFQLAIYFAATVGIVFTAGFLAPRLARRWGQPVAALLGAVIALAGGALMLGTSGTPGLIPLTTGFSLFLFGMGIANPVGTAVALHPFGAQAGLASALLGFLQMGSAALGATLVSQLPFAPVVSLAAILTLGALLGVAALLPGARTRSAAPRPA